MGRRGRSPVVFSFFFFFRAPVVGAAHRSGETVYARAPLTGRLRGLNPPGWRAAGDRGGIVVGSRVVTRGDATLRRPCGARGPAVRSGARSPRRRLGERTPSMDPGRLPGANRSLDSPAGSARGGAASTIGLPALVELAILMGSPGMAFLILTSKRWPRRRRVGGSGIFLELPLVRKTAGNAAVGRLSLGSALNRLARGDTVLPAPRPGPSEDRDPPGPLGR